MEGVLNPPADERSSRNNTFAAFAARANRASGDPSRSIRAGLALVDGAVRIRRGGDGLYGNVERPITKQAEAVGAWIRSMEPEILGGDFHRQAELREAVIAAAEEVDAAVAEAPAASRLQGALYTDALDALGAQQKRPTSILPWVIAGVLGGILVGVIVMRR